MANPRTIARLEAQILRRAAHCIQFELADPRAGFITLTRVELSNDLTSARIYYSVLGDEGERTKAESLFEQAGGFIQRQVARVLHTRTVPHLKWIFDETIVRAAEMDLLIRRARERDEAIRAAGAGSGTDSEDSGEEEANEGGWEEAHH